MSLNHLSSSTGSIYQPSLVVGSLAVSPALTNGFTGSSGMLFISACQGSPTGAPEAPLGTSSHVAPVMFDQLGGDLWIYNYSTKNWSIVTSTGSGPVSTGTTGAVQLANNSGGFQSSPNLNFASGVLGVTGSETINATSHASGLTVQGTGTSTGTTTLINLAVNLDPADYNSMVQSGDAAIWFAGPIGSSTSRGLCIVPDRVGVASGLRIDNVGVSMSGTNSVVGTLAMTGTLSLVGNSSVTGTTTLVGALNVTGNPTVTGTTSLVGALNVTGNPTVTGTTELIGDLGVIGNTVATGTAYISSGVGIGTAAPATPGLALLTSGGSASTLNYYEEWSGTVSLTGATLLQSFPVNITRIGNMVTLHAYWQGTGSNAAGGSTMTGAAGSIPARFCPSTGSVSFTYDAIENGTPGGPGVILFYDNGTIVMYADPTTAKFTANSNSTGMYDICSFTWLRI